MRNIPFSPPDITELEIQEVCEALRSGWITTGPKSKQFEREKGAGRVLPCGEAGVPELRYGGGGDEPAGAGHR